MLRLLDHRRPRLLLTLFCLLLWAPGFFTLPAGDRDESRFAQATKQMLETGDFVRIMNGDEMRNRKPIGIYWMQAPFAAAARATGIARANPIWPYRLPSALGALVGVLATFALGRQLIGQRAALLGAAFLAACVVLTAEVHIAKTDAVLLACTVLAMSVLARAYAREPIVAAEAALFWLALAAGILVKGPITPMVAALTALTLALADRDGRWLWALRPGWGVALMLAAVLPWFVAIGIATDGGFFSDAVGRDLARKIVSGDESHGGPPGLHLLLLPALLLPAAAAIPGSLLAAWSERRNPAPRFLLAWIVPSWIIFEAAPTKLPHYPLPLYPALALLAAWWLLRPGRRPIGRVAAGLPIVIAILLAGAMMALPIALHLTWTLGIPAALAGLLIASCYLPLLRRPDVGRPQTELRALVAGALCLIPFYTAALGLEIPRLRPLWFAPAVAAVLPPGRMAAVGFSEPSLMFTVGTDTAWRNAQDAATSLASGETTSIAVSDRELPAVLDWLRKLGVTPTRVADIKGYNYSRGRPTTLTVLTRSAP